MTTDPHLSLTPTGIVVATIIGNLSGRPYLSKKAGQLVVEQAQLRLARRYGWRVRHQAAGQRGHNGFLQC